MSDDGGRSKPQKRAPALAIFLSAGLLLAVSYVLWRTGDQRAQGAGREEASME